MTKPHTESLLVSVILCNYNYGQFIAEAIDSVLEQTYSNFELIIVDDGSTDNSREVIASYNDPRIKIILQENGGQAAAFNAGFAVAQGEIIAFLDSDDFWSKDKLDIVVQTFKNSSNVVLVQHSNYVVDEKSLQNGEIHPNISFSGNVLEKYFIENHSSFYSTTSGISCNHNKLKNIFPLDESWKICADVLFSRPMALFGNIITLSEILGFYRVHNKNNWMNTKEQKEQIKNCLKYEYHINSILNKFGEVRKINFKQSRKYQNYKAEIWQKELQKELNAKKNMLQNIYNSKSWKITKPLRAMSKYYKKLRDSDA